MTCRKILYKTNKLFECELIEIIITMSRKLPKKVINNNFQVE
jgi:hypothetical protein